MVQVCAVSVAEWPTAPVLQQPSVVVLRPEPDTESPVAVHLSVDQWQLQPQLSECPVAHVDLPERELLEAELPDLRLRHVAATCQVVVAHEPLPEKVVQGVEPCDREVVREARELQDAHEQKVLREVVLAEFVEFTVLESVWRKHVEVDARLLLVPCRPHQLCEWVVQDCLCRDERELVQRVAELPCQWAWSLPCRHRRQQLVAQLPKDVVREEQQLLLEPARLQLVRELRQQRQLVCGHLQQLQSPPLRRW